MLVKGDKIVAKKNIHNVIEKGEVCEVISNENGFIAFSFGNGLHKGLMTVSEFEENFEMYVEQKAPTITETMINDILDNAKIMTTTTFDKCTIVSCQLPNGFVITESSACVDPKNYDLELGKEICMKKIKDKVLELEGYLLQQTLWEDNLLFDDYDDDDTEDDCDNDCNECDEYLNGYCDGCQIDREDEYKGKEDKYINDLLKRLI